MDPSMHLRRGLPAQGLPAPSTFEQAVNGVNDALNGAKEDAARQNAELDKDFDAVNGVAGSLAGVRAEESKKAEAARPGDRRTTPTQAAPAAPQGPTPPLPPPTRMPTDPESNL